MCSQLNSTWQVDTHMVLPQTKYTSTQRYNNIQFYRGTVPFYPNPMSCNCVFSRKYCLVAETSGITVGNHVLPRLVSNVFVRVQLNIAAMGSVK